MSLANSDFLIDVRAVTRTYPSPGGEVHALRGVDLQVQAGDYVALMGPSGSGKTTVFNLIGALDHPTRGRVYLGGHDLQTLTPAQLAYVRCARLGYVFQNYHLLETLSARQNVMLPQRFLGRTDDEAGARADALLDRVGLAARASHRPAELSGGQQQRVALARALANDPAVLLADEPTANLDSRTALEIIGLLAALGRERGVTIIAATHDPRLLEVADRVISLRDGRIEREVRRGDPAHAAGPVAKA